jgi:transcriptional regulator with PAS, ATPase and Fis domain
VRLLASSKSSLEDLVNEGTLRQDLFYRLQVVTIELPPLRDRKEDIPILANRFIDREAVRASRLKRGLSREAIEYLVSRDWPGNVRELEHVLRRTLVLSEGTGLIQKEELVGFLSAKPRDSVVPMTSKKKDGLDTTERARILAALEKNRWNRTRAAKELGIPRRTFYRRIEKLGLAKK